jgi:hypothetical protein
MTGAIMAEKPGASKAEIDCDAALSNNLSENENCDSQALSPSGELGARPNQTGIPEFG